MWQGLRKKNLWARILLGAVILGVALSMLLYLVPGQGPPSESRPDVLADVGGQPVTIVEVRQQLQRVTQRGGIPRALESLYMQQILNQLVYERMLEQEAQRLGIQVTDQERADRIRQLVPTAMVGDTFVGAERYAEEVQLRFGMGVGEFEELVRRGLLEEKVRRLVTDGVDVTPEEVEQEFRRRNEKIKLEYVVVKPEDLEARVPINEAELAAHFEKNKSRYVVPERRVARFALLDFNQVRQRATVPEEESRAYYNQNIENYRLQNRVHVSHILFKTVGKTDAEVEEIRSKAEEILKRAKRGAKFEELAKQYSEDTTKEKGGDLGWLIHGQTVAEFESAAFSLPKGAVSDLVKTQYGFHIIKVIDREAARTQGFDEVRASIVAALSAARAERVANETAEKIGAAVRQSSRQPVEELAKQFDMTVGEAGPVAANDTAIGELGNAPEVREAMFRLRVGDLSQPVRIDRGYVVVSLKEIQASHPATLAEVRGKVEADFRREKAVDLVTTRAEELARRGQSGENLAAVGKALGFAPQQSELIARAGVLPGVGSARQISAAFSAPVGHTAGPVQAGSSWVVYRVVEREEAKQEEFEKQKKEIQLQVLQEKRQLAYEAFRTALQERMKREGKLRLMTDNIKRLGGPRTSM